MMGPKPAATFSNDYLKPLNTEGSQIGGANFEERIVDQLLQVYWKIDSDEII